MGLSIRDPPPPEANPRVVLRPKIVLEYWPPVVDMEFQAGSVKLKISVQRRNHSHLLYDGPDSDILYGTLEVPGEKEGKDQLHYTFTLDNLCFQEAAKDAVWTLQADLVVGGIHLHKLVFPGIHVHTTPLPKGKETFKEQKAAESRTKENFREKLHEARTKMNRGEPWW